MRLLERLAATVVEHRGHLLRPRVERADDDAVVARMRSEVTVRLWMGAIGEKLGVGHAASTSSGRTTGPRRPRGHRPENADVT